MSSSNLVCVNPTPTNVGLRVVRGPDWKWGNQDDGEGHVGTVVEIGQTGSPITPEKTVIVQWDSGNRSNYRVGYQNAYDLRVLDNAQIGIIHYGITCIYCDSRSSNTTATTNTTANGTNVSLNGGTSYITGIRWKCTQCPEVNLCSRCYHLDRHSLSHLFERYDAPALPPVSVASRASSNVKFNVKGIFVNAKVIRGYDWDWDNQDGGAGKIGKVVDIRGWTTDSFRSVANVIWPSGVSNVYRLGHRGKVDLKYVAEADGGKYYRDHLPIFSIFSDSLYLPTAPSYPVTNTHCISKVDTIASNTTIASHSTHGASNNDNNSCISNCNSNGFSSIHGTLVNNTGDIVTNNDTIDQSTTTVTPTTSLNNTVATVNTSNTSVTRVSPSNEINSIPGAASTSYRTDWSSSQAPCSSVIAPSGISGSQVTASSCSAFTASNGDVVSNAASSAGTPIAASSTSSSSSTVVSSSTTATATNASSSTTCTSVSACASEPVECIVSASTCTSNKTPGTAALATPSSSSSTAAAPCTIASSASAAASSRFKVGYKVKVIKDRHELRVMQTGHGGWNPKMAKYCHQIGVVHRLTVAGDVRVKFGLGDKFPKYTFHPESLAIVYFVGDTVKVIDDENKVKMLQEKHGEWVDPMKAILGTQGKVIEIYMDGDLRVSFDTDKAWTLNPETVCLVESNMATLESALTASALAASSNNSPVATSVTSAITANEIDDSTLGNGDTNMLNSLSPRFAQISLDEPHLVHQNTHGGASSGRIFHSISGNRHTLPDLSDVVPYEASMTHSPSSTSVPLAIPALKHSRTSHHSSSEGGHVLVRKDKNNRSLLSSSNPPALPGGSGVTSGQNADERVKYLESKIAEMEEVYCCGICLERVRNVVFLCGHGACVNCAQSLRTCHMCRQVITRKINIY